MNTIALNTPLTISDISIRQDDQGRYCLNDLHIASGNESKHKPANFIRNQQAIDLIELLKSEKLEPINVINGIGTLAVKELVYAYAMWISAKFHLSVIRAYDALVTGQPQYGLKALPIKKTQKALPGCLSLETQDEIKQLIQDHAARLPKDKQARYIISMWSALGSHFEIKKDKGDKTPAYKYIKEEARLECLSLLARWSVDDLVTLTLEQFEEKINEHIKALPAPAPLEGEVLPQQQHNSITINLAPLEHGKVRRWLVSQLATEIAMLHPLSEDQIITTKAEFIDDLIKKNDYVVMKKDQLIGKVQAIF